MGDVVNLSARLMGACELDGIMRSLCLPASAVSQRSPTGVLVDEKTRAACVSLQSNPLLFQALDHGLSLKGKGCVRCVTISLSFEFRCCRKVDAKAKLINADHTGKQGLVTAFTPSFAPTPLRPAEIPKVWIFQFQNIA